MGNEIYGGCVCFAVTSLKYIFTSNGLIILVEFLDSRILIQRDVEFKNEAGEEKRKNLS